MTVCAVLVRKMGLILLSSLLLAGTSSVGCAQDAKDDKDDKAAVSEAPAVKETPLTRLDAARASLTKGLEDNLLRQFAAIDSSYGTVRAVENVQLSVGRAVKACVQSNPDMDASMTGRFEAWNDALRPVIKKARSKIDKMILLQGFAQPSQMRAYLRLFDAAIIYRNEGIVETPVSSKPECEKLLANMDKTQEDIIRLMTESLALDKQLQIKGL